MPRMRLCEFGDGLEAGESATDHDDGGVIVRLEKRIVQSRGGVEVGDGERLLRTGDRVGTRGAADGVDHRVAPQDGPVGEGHRVRLDPYGRADVQRRSRVQEIGQFVCGGSGSGRHLVEPDAFDEDRSRVHDGDRHPGMFGEQAVRGHHSGVARPYDHHMELRRHRSVPFACRKWCHR